jgi:isocitrate/isopropylmalate dehydrogenase
VRANSCRTQRAICYLQRNRLLVCRRLQAHESPRIERPLKDTGADIDFVVVRENNEGEYSEIGGRIYYGQEDEIAIQESVFTRRGVTSAMRYAFELSRCAATEK